MNPNVRRIAAMAAALALAAAAPAWAQEQPAGQLKGFWLTTPHPELAVSPGKTETIQLTLRNAGLPPQRASIEVTGVPQGWQWHLRGGGREVGAVMVGPDETERLNLEITPAAGAPRQEFPIDVSASYGSGTIRLPIVLRLSDQAAERGLTLDPELPALRGTARSTFSYRVKVTNEGSEQGLFSLAANVPEGFQTRFKRGYGSEEITGLPIEAGASENVTVEVIPSRATPAGRYPISVEISGNGTSAVAELSLEVTGQPEVRIIGPQERLSGEAVAGRESSFTFTLANTGSAPATDVELAATPPSGWVVEFEPKRIDSIAPNTTSEFNARITPSERAIAGDYVVTVRASGGSGAISESVQFRTTVKTSTVWGAVGLGVIAAAALVLGMAVMRYGRR